MLKSIAVAGYKSYDDKLTTIELGRLNIFLGKNNSGKTAAARLPALILNSSSSSFPNRLPIHLTVQGLRYGSRVQDLVHGQSPHGSLRLGLTIGAGFEALNDDISFSTSVQIQQSIDAGQRAVVIDFDSNLLGGRLVYDGLPGFGAAAFPRGVEKFEGLLPRLKDQKSDQAIQRLRGAMDSTQRSMSHLVAVRDSVQRHYEVAEGSEVADVSGSEVPWLLNTHPELLARVSRWYEDNLGVSVEMQSDEMTFSLMVRRAGQRTRSNLADAGQGLQQVLPVIARLAACELGLPEYQLLVMEEPELHLHPAAHSPLGLLSAQAASTRSRSQIILETHSENLVLRVRRQVALKQLMPEDVRIYWFDDSWGATRVREIAVRPDGSVEDWPRGVFSEDLEEVRQLTKIQRS